MKNIEWKEVKLGELIEIIAGQAPPSASYNQEKKGLAFLRINSFGEKYPINDSWTTESLKSCKEGDILLSVAGTIGAVNIADKDYSITRSIFALRPNTNKIHRNYLYYFLKTLKIKLTNSGTGSSQKIITLGTVNNLRLFLPFLPNGTSDLKEQERIVSILEKAEALRQKGKSVADLLDEYLKSVFNEMFLKKEFNLVPLKSVCPTYRKIICPKNIDKNLFYVGLENIESGTGIIMNKINAYNQNLKSTKFFFNSDCILYGKLRPYLNKIALPNFEGVCSTDILPLKPLKDKSNKYYLAYLLRTKKLVDKANFLCSGANLPRLSPKYLENFKISLPPLPLQEKFASIVERVEKMKENVNKTKKSSEELFNSLMQKAFRGEL